jgi:hypothetical protein
MPLLVFIAVQFIAFTAAGLFTSRIIASSTEALYPTGACGYWQSLVVGSWDEYNAAAVNARGVMESSDRYVDDCYGAVEQVLGPECHRYARRMIESRINTNALCPFTDWDTCLDPFSNIRLDTGYIDTNKDLGINAPPEHSLFYRKISTCALVDSTNWLSGYASDFWSTNYVKGPSDVLPGAASVYYHFGRGFNYDGKEDGHDYVFSVSNYSRYSADQAYSLWSVSSQ